MPTVPVPKYEQPLAAPAAEPTQRFQTNAPLEVFGGGDVTKPIDAAGKLASQANVIFQDEQRKADEVAAADAVAKAKQKKIDLMYNEQTGALFQKGQNAFNLPNTVPAEFTKFGDELIGTLSNDRQKELVRRNLLNESNDINQQVQMHVGQERQRYDGEVTTGLVKTASDDAVLNYQDPARVEQNIALARGAILKNAERQGKSGVEVERVINDTTSGIHTAIIERYLDNGKDLAAKAYYDQHKDSLNGVNTMHVEKALEQGSLIGESQRRSDEIFSKTSDLGQALSMVKDIEDPKIRQATQQQVVQTFDLKKKALQENSEQQLDVVLRNLETSKGQFELPATKLATMNTKDIQTFEARKKQILNGVEAPSNGADYYNLRTMASDPTLQPDFMKLNLRDYATKMPAAELSKLIEHQADLRSGNHKSDKVLGQYRSQNEVINSILLENKIDPTPKPGTDDAALVERLRTRVEQQSIQFAQETGKAPTNEQLKKFADSEMLKVTVDKSGIFGSTFFQTKKQKALLNEGETGTVRAKDIPPEERAKVESALRSRNLPVTDDAVESLFNQYHSRK